MKKSTYMDRAMKAKDPRFARVLSKLGYQRSDMQPAEDAGLDHDELAAVREEYQQAVGKRPYHGWDVDTLRAKIAEAKDE